MFRTYNRLLFLYIFGPIYIFAFHHTVILFSCKNYISVEGLGDEDLEWKNQNKRRETCWGQKAGAGWVGMRKQVMSQECWCLAWWRAHNGGLLCLILTISPPSLRELVVQWKRDEEEADVQINTGLQALEWTIPKISAYTSSVLIFLPKTIHNYSF